MRPTDPHILLSALSVLALGTPVLAQSLEGAAIQAEPQYYLMSLPPAPVGEIAEAVLGEALGLPFKVDDDVDAEMRFQVDGVYAPKALAQEFGYRLWNIDVVLIEKPSDGLWLIPESELTAALAQGATVVAPLAATQAAARKQAAPSPPVAAGRVSDPQSAGWSWLGWLVAGWATGAASMIGWQSLRRGNLPVPPRLPAPPPPVTDPMPDDLIIPVFVPQSDQATQPTAPSARI